MPMSGLHTTTDKWRLFFAFWPTESIRQAISDINHRFIKSRGRPVADSNLHLTLVFLGTVEKNRVDTLLADVSRLTMKCVTLQLDRLQWWRRPRVISLVSETVPDSLQKLHAGLTEAAARNGIVVDRRPYLPHVTLRRKVNARPQLPPFTPVIWQLQEFCLVRSVTHRQGASYDVIWRSR